MPQIATNETGATIVEFALATVVLMALFGVLFDVGLGIHRYAMVKQVTSDVTRMIAEDLQTHRNCAQVRKYFEDYATPQLTQRLELNVHPTWNMTWDTSGTGDRFPVMKVKSDFRVKCFFLCSFAKDGGWRVSTSSQIVIERSGIGPGGSGCPATTVTESNES